MGNGSPAQGAGPPALISLIAASIRRERDRSGLSLTELARRAGIAKSTLSQLESGVGNPGVETLWALSVALGVPFSRLVDQPRPVVRVIRAGEGPVTYAERASYAATLLASCPPGARRDIYHIQVQPGQRHHRSDDHGAHLRLAPGQARFSARRQGRHRQNSLPSGSARTNQLRAPWPTSTCRAPRASSRSSSAA